MPPHEHGLSAGLSKSRWGSIGDAEVEDGKFLEIAARLKHNGKLRDKCPL